MIDEREMAALLQEGAAIDIGEAAHADAAAAGQLDQRGQIIVPDADAGAMEWVFVGEMLGALAGAIFPEVEKYYTDEAALRLARKIAPVAEKYGWQGMESSPEIGLGLAALGFAMPCVMAYKTRKAEAAALAAKDADGS